MDHKPEWMDSGPKEAKIAEEMKNLVKESLKRKKSDRSSVRQQARKGARERPSTNASAGITQSNTLSTFVPEINSNSFAEIDDSIPGSAATSVTFPSTNEPTNDFGTSVLTEEDEDPALLQDRTRLLMHFFDHVFPTEYPFYRAHIFEGGRGWLMSLVMRSRPLYHAALSVSAYHQTALITAKSTQCRYQTWQAIQEHHTLALQELQKNMVDLRSREITLSIEDGVDVLASIVQLTSFEVGLRFHLPCPC